MISIFTRKPKTIIHSLFNVLQVDYSALYLENLIQYHPNGGSMLGISDILNDYKVENISLKMDPLKFSDLDAPFIAQRTHPALAFDLITRINAHEVVYINEGGDTKKEDYNSYIQRCSGIAQSSVVFH